MDITVRFERPEIQAYYSLYQTTGWDAGNRFSSDDLARALLNSQSVVAAYDNDRLVGFGRVMTDGVLQYRVNP